MMIRWLSFHEAAEAKGVSYRLAACWDVGLEPNEEKSLLDLRLQKFPRPMAIDDAICHFFFRMGVFMVWEEDPNM